VGLRLGIVGCGNIARRYTERIQALDELELVAASDALPGRADALVADFGGKAYDSLPSLLADERVDAVVNLTSPAAHAEVTAAALDAGKHVHSEKPLALRHDEARDLVNLASTRGLRLSAAPATLLGDAQQTAWKLLREKAIGHVRVAYAEANWGRIETWHPAPTALYAVGPMVDVGVYPLAVLTAIFGPARSVTAFATTVQPERVALDGTPFRPDAPDLTVAVVELESGLVIRLTASFYVGAGIHRGLEFHGDGGMLWLASWAEFDSRLRITTDFNGDNYEPVPLLREGYRGIDWGRALVDLAGAVEDGREPRASGAHAAHVVEVLNAMQESARDGGPVAVGSSFHAPAPLEWAL
jgi:predicted dehydrogenase